MSIEFEALKADTAKLIQLTKDQAAEIALLKTQIANPPPQPAPDPAPADVAALDADIKAALDETPTA